MPRPQALRLHPELGPAFAIDDAAKGQLEQRGVAPYKQGVVLDKVWAEVAEQISRRGVQSIVADRGGPQVSPERCSIALFTKPDCKGCRAGHGIAGRLRVCAGHWAVAARAV